MPATNDDTRYTADTMQDDSLWDRMSEMAASDDDADDWDDEEDDWDEDWDDEDDEVEWEEEDPGTLRRRRFDDER